MESKSAKTEFGTKVKIVWKNERKHLHLSDMPLGYQDLMEKVHNFLNQCDPNSDFKTKPIVIQANFKKVVEIKDESDFQKMKEELSNEVQPAKVVKFLVFTDGFEAKKQQKTADWCFTPGGQKADKAGKAMSKEEREEFKKAKQQMKQEMKQQQRELKQVRKAEKQMQKMEMKQPQFTTTQEEEGKVTKKGKWQVPPEKAHFQQVKRAFKKELERRAGYIYADMASIAAQEDGGGSFTAKDVLERHVTVHKDVPCHSCGIKSIIGVRYKSLVFQDLNLCGACEAMDNSGQALVKLPMPEGGVGVKYASNMPLENLAEVRTREGRHNEEQKLEKGMAFKRLLDEVVILACSNISFFDEFINIEDKRKKMLSKQASVGQAEKMVEVLRGLEQPYSAKVGQSFTLELEIQNQSTLPIKRKTELRLAQSYQGPHLKFEGKSVPLRVAPGGKFTVAYQVEVPVDLQARFLGRQEVLLQFVHPKQGNVGNPFKVLVDLSV